MKVHVGVADQRWYEFLRDRQAEEVNFRGPSGRGFAAVRPGEPLLFKTRLPHHSLVGGGVFVQFEQVPLSAAWEFFGERNGVASPDGLRTSVERNLHRRRAPDDGGYIGVHPVRRTLEVSPRLRSEFGNGEEFCARAGDPIRLPGRPGERPHPDLSFWHMDAVFRA